MKKEVLSKLFETTRENKTSEEYNELRIELREMKEKFLEKVGKDRQEELEQIVEMVYRMNDILDFEDFCNGFSMAVKIFVEATYKEMEINW